MHRSHLVIAALLATVQPLGADQVERFRLSTSRLADVHQETLQEIVPESTQAPVEVFPGAYESPIGAAVMARVETIMGRVDDADRRALVARNVRAGFDRSMLTWRANAAGRLVVLAVRYYRQPLFDLDLQVTDDYGRADPVDPFRSEFLAIAVCARAADAWTCVEEPLAAAASRLGAEVPQGRADRITFAEKLVGMILARNP